jgi:hypothetical protein
MSLSNMQIDRDVEGQTLATNGPRRELPFNRRGAEAIVTTKATTLFSPSYTVGGDRALFVTLGFHRCGQYASIP